MTSRECVPLPLAHLPSSALSGEDSALYAAAAAVLASSWRGAVPPLSLSFFPAAFAADGWADESHFETDEDPVGSQPASLQIAHADGWVGASPPGHSLSPAESLSSVVGSRHPREFSTTAAEAMAAASTHKGIYPLSAGKFRPPPPIPFCVR